MRTFDPEYYFLGAELLHSGSELVSIKYFMARANDIVFITLDEITTERYTVSLFNYICYDPIQ